MRSALLLRATMAAFAVSVVPATATAIANAQPAPPAPVAPLGLAPGHYVEETSTCGDPVGGVFFYDGRRYGMMYPSTTGPEVLDRIGQPRRRGAMWVMPDGSGVERLSPTRLRWTYEETGPPMRWCPAAAVPARVRVPAR